LDYWEASGKVPRERVEAVRAFLDQTRDG
jgi:hypothetical protein